MHQCVQGLPLDGAQADDAHAAVFLCPERDEGIAVEYRDLVAALDEAGARLFHEGLKAAISRGYPPGAEKSDMQFLWGHPRVTYPRSSRRASLLHRRGGGFALE